MADDLEDMTAAWLGRDPGSVRHDELLARLRSDAKFRGEFAAEARVIGLLSAISPGDEARIMQRLPTSRPRRRWAMVAAAMIGIAVGLVAISLRTTAPGDSVAVVVVGDIGIPPGEAISTGPLVIPSGIATLAFYTGVTLTIEGPAEIELRSHDTIYCSRGRLRAEVPPGAEGFTVLTAGSAIIDRGTEFGVNVNDGRSEVMVFRGLADVAALDGGGQPVGWKPVAAGQAVEIAGPANIRRTAPDPGLFVGPSKPEPPPLRLAASYPAAVIAAKPWGYWRFETANAKVVQNEIAGQPVLLSHGGATTMADPGGNGCAVFFGFDANQGYALDGVWSPPATGEYAVELWALTETFRHSTLAGLGRPAAFPDEQTHMLELTARRPRGIYAGCAARVLDRWPPGHDGGVNVYATTPYVPNRWYHVVGQLTGSRVELYIDGEKVGDAPVAPGRRAGEFGLMLGRLAPVGSSRQIDYRLLTGRLDEVAVYNHPLTPDEIRAHHSAGQ